MNFVERALKFDCLGSALYGVLTMPDQVSRQGVLIVVGGPQYRIGSHRQFVLLARGLAEAGIPALRFDYRGMGDSEGDMRGFEEVGDDIRAALDRFALEVPNIKEFIIFGLCDATCAALSYAHQDPRISGLVLINPWVRTNDGLAKAYLKHYYLTRLFDRELWQKIGSGQFDARRAGRSFLEMLAMALPRRSKKSLPKQTVGTPSTQNLPLPEQMLEGVRRFKGNILFILSGNDLTANEFLNLAEGSRHWKKVLASPRIKRHALPDANHTFSRRDWRDDVLRYIKEWISSF